MREPGWITKREAATLADVDERTIERKARAGKITSKGRPGFPTLYLLTDVELLQQTGNGDVRTGILEHVPASNGNGHSAVASVRSRSASVEEMLDLVLDRLLAKLPQGPIGPTGPTIAPTGPTLSPEEVAAQWVTLADAAVIKGRTTTYLLRKIHDGTLTAEKDRGWKIRRKDLEQL